MSQIKQLLLMHQQGCSIKKITRTLGMSKNTVKGYLRKLAANADYGADYDVTRFWKISTDPNHPKVGFSARVDAAGLKPGRHWLGLRLRGADGSVETWSEQAFEVPAH